MARGKKAAHSANRRAREAAETTQEINERHKAERAQWERERATLQAEVQRLGGLLATEVATRAREQSETIRIDAERRIAAAEEARLSAAWAVVEAAMKDNKGFKAPWSAYNKIAQLLEVPTGQLMTFIAPEASNRKTRRATAGVVAANGSRELRKHPGRNWSADDEEDADAVRPVEARERVDQ